MSDTATDTKPVEETPPVEETTPKPENAEAEATPTAATEEQPETTEAPTTAATVEAPTETTENKPEETAATVAESGATAEPAEEEAQPESEPEPIEIPAGNGELVLVTGACGYLGSHVVKLLADSGEYRVRGTVRSLEENERLDSLKSLLENAKYQPEFVEADLMNADSWPEAVKDCEYVLHVASPFPSTPPTNPSEIIELAKEGTLSVLKACAEAGTVKRVVITSSCASIYSGRPVGKEPLTEEAWADVEKAGTAYNQSKAMAEQAAWDFMKELPEGSTMELSVVNPGFILGPPLMKMDCTSIEFVKKLMHREWSMIPKMSFPVIDVRDAALAHLRAMVIKQSAGKRHIAASSTYWVKDIANFLSQEFSNKGFNVATTQAPYVIAWVQSHFNPQVKQLLPDMGKFYLFDNSRMKNILQVEPRPAKDTVVEMGHSLVNFGIAQKVEKPEKKARKLTFRKKKPVKEEGEEKKDEPEKIKDNGSAHPSTDEADPEEVKVVVNGTEPAEKPEETPEETPKEELAEETKEEAAAPAAAAADDADKIEAAAVSSEEEAKEETPDPESTKAKKEKPKKEKKRGLSLFSFKSKNKKHVEKKSADKPAEEVPAAEEAATEETPAATEETPAATEETPAATEETPAAAEETPAAVEEAPAATEETPVAVEETPAAAEQAPESKEETPAPAEETPAAAEEDKPAEKSEEETATTTEESGVTSKGETPTAE